MQTYGHIYHRCDDPWNKAPPWALELREMLSLILCQMEFIMADIDDLEVAVKANTDAEGSAEIAFLKIAAMIAALKSTQTDPATSERIRAASATLKANAERLAAAVVANTPAETPA